MDCRDRCRKKIVERQCCNSSHAQNSQIVNRLLQIYGNVRNMVIQWYMFVFDCYSLLPSSLNFHRGLRCSIDFLETDRPGIDSFWCPMVPQKRVSIEIGILVLHPSHTKDSHGWVEGSAQGSVLMCVKRCQDATSTKFHSPPIMIKTPWVYRPGIFRCAGLSRGLSEARGRDPPNATRIDVSNIGDHQQGSEWLSYWCVERREFSGIHWRTIKSSQIYQADHPSNPIPNPSSNPKYKTHQ